MNLIKINSKLYLNIKLKLKQFKLINFFKKKIIFMFMVSQFNSN